jgi:hypothetical protein
VGTQRGSDTYQDERAKGFGQWLTGMLQHVKASRLELARALDSADLLKLRPKPKKNKNDRRVRKVKRYHPKQEVGKYCAGKMMPGAIVAYRIGAALERMGAPCSGLDALIMAQRWTDAIGCIGEYIRAYDPGVDYNPSTGAIEEDPYETRVITDVFACRLHGPLPEAMRPAMEQAWIKWLNYKDPKRFLARIEAAFVLAASPYEKEHAIAKQILSERAPLGFILDRNAKRFEDPREDVEEEEPD